MAAKNTVIFCKLNGHTGGGMKCLGLKGCKNAKSTGEGEEDEEQEAQHAQIEIFLHINIKGVESNPFPPLNVPLFCAYDRCPICTKLACIAVLFRIQVDGYRYIAVLPCIIGSRIHFKCVIVLMSHVFAIFFFNGST